LRVLVRALSGAFFIAASLYCFISFIPYTYLFLIKTPPYAWIAAFAEYAPLFYWLAFIAGLVGFWQQRRSYAGVAAFAAQGILGLYFTWKHLLVSIGCNWSALVWGLLLLLPVLLLSISDLVQCEVGRDFVQSQAEVDSAGHQGTLVPYSTGLLVAAAAALVSILAIGIYRRHETGGFGFSRRDLELFPFVIAAHVWLTVLLLTGLNAVQFFVQKRSGRPRWIRRWIVMAIVAGGLTFSILRFVGNTLTAQTWYHGLYAAALAATLVCWVSSLLSALWSRPEETGFRRWLPWVMLVGGVLIGLIGPAMVADGDWNGLLQDLCVLLCWFLLATSLFRLRSSETRYSIPGIAATVVVAGFMYFGVRASGFVWAHQVGHTDEEIAQALGDYQAENASFELAAKALSSPAATPCDDFCRTLRQYTNVENAEVRKPLRLVEKLEPASGPRPNIFIFVVDSLRADYLGAYNPKVDFTPHLDALAADSVVMKNAFTPYAGTTLAEPAIWTGALLLHSHYQHPFDKLDLLKALAKTDGYKMVLSYDTILRRLLAPGDVDVKLDADKPWKSLDLESTTREFEHYLDNHAGDKQPILFYTQPIDVQELGRAEIPEKTNANWRERPGFNNRIAYHLAHADAALGEFVAYLKKHDLYDKSVIIVTADHGDALGDMARRGHSYILYPEIMHIPLIIHLPRQLRSRLICDPGRLASLIDITPTLYYVLGHRPIRSDVVLGQPLFFESAQEMQQYHREHLLLASDIRAGYGIVTADGGSMYVTYDSPRHSYLFDLANDPLGARNVVTDDAKKEYNALILNDLEAIASFYEYKPTGGETGMLHWDRVMDVPSGYFAQEPARR
jgi:arylsulfatase A-like enzyme